MVQNTGGYFDAFSMKIKLILSAATNDPLSRRAPFMPLSLPILAGLAPGHHYVFCDMLRGEIPDPARDGMFDLIGISYRASSEKEAFALADAYRQRGKLVVLGGPQATSDPHTAAQHADIVAVGEAEHTWGQIVADAEASTPKKFYIARQLAFRPEAGDYFVATRDDFEKLPLPNRRLFRHRYSFNMVYAVRGCPINCDFCFVSDMFGTLCRTRPVSTVVSEISTFRGFYYLIDDTVFGRPSTYNYYTQLYQEILKLQRQNLWTGQANLDAAATPRGREVISLAAKAGLAYAAIGMESVTPETLVFSGTLAKMGVNDSHDPMAQMAQNIAFIQNCGIAVSGWFVIGYPADTIDTYYKTLDFCLANHVFPVITPVSALRGTRLYNVMASQGKLRDREKHASNITHSAIRDKDITTALRYIVAKGFSLPVIWRNSWFYYTKFRKSGKGVNDALKRTIFVFITQLRLKEVLVYEINRIHEKTGF